MGRQPDQLAGDLLVRIWITRGCYFNLSDRLRRKARYSNASITFLSFYVFIVSLIPIAKGAALPEEYKTAVAVVTVVLSVFIIIITLLENSKEYRLDAEFSTQTAQRLEALYGRYEAHKLNKKATDVKLEATFRTGYSSILIDARTTRRTIDYVLFQWRNPDDFGFGLWTRWALVPSLIWNGIMEYWIYAAMILLPPLGAALFWLNASSG